jgi:hypothetical protein
MNYRFWIPALFILLILTGCGEDENNKPSDPTPEITPTTEIEVTPAPTLSDAERQQLEASYSILSEAHTQIEGIWSDLQAGQSVECATPLNPQISPDGLAGEDVISQTLQQAAIEIETAVNLWQAECQNPRPQPPADVIDRGVRAALAAGQALEAASELLRQ